jgi:predicted DsbA family dithiol-disulfide isomerase
LRATALLHECFMQIDFISDTVCPWCFIGKRRLAKAMTLRPNIAFDVRYRPFRLDPSIPKGGLERASYLAAKFGKNGGIEEAQRVIAAEGAKEGIEFDFAAVLRAPNTLDSHRLIRWAGLTGAQDEVVERLFAAYFENGEDIGDLRVLSDIADVCGMDGAQVADMLESDLDLNLVEREDQLAREMGVTGVPAMIFANKVAVSGAREPEVLTMVIDKALEMAAQVES